MKSFTGTVPFPLSVGCTLAYTRPTPNKESFFFHFPGIWKPMYPVFTGVISVCCWLTQKFPDISHLSCSCFSWLTVSTHLASIQLTYLYRQGGSYRQWIYREGVSYFLLRNWRQKATECIYLDIFLHFNIWCKVLLKLYTYHHLPISIIWQTVEVIESVL